MKAMIFDAAVLLFMLLIAFKAGEYKALYKSEKNRPRLHSKHRTIAIYYLQRTIRDIKSEITDSSFPEIVEDSNKRHDIDCLEGAIDFLNN